MNIRAVLVLGLLFLASFGVWLFASRRASSRQVPAVPVTGQPIAPTAAKPEVPIQDGKTIDFSTGKPVVKGDSADQAALVKSLAAMEAAAKDVTFSPKAAAGGTGQSPKN